MRLLKRQPGLPFLMALGVLLILSASFLAVQLWSDKAYRGAVEALEAPVMPPSMPTSRKGKSAALLDKKIEKAKTVAAVEVVTAPDIQKTEDISEPVAVAAPEPEKARPVALKPARLPEMIEAPAMPPNAGVREKPVKPAAKATAAKEAVEKPTAPVVRPTEVKTVEPVTTVVAEPLVEEPVSKVAAAESKTPVDSAPAAVAPAKKPVSASLVREPAAEPQKAAAPRRKAVRVEDESEIPQEWNWFDTPLKLELSHGHVEIVPATTPRVVRLVTVSARLPETDMPVSLTGGSSVSVDAAVALDKPFVTALARMVRLRKVRAAAIAKDPELEKAVLARRSESLAKLQETVARLSDRLVSPTASTFESPITVDNGNMPIEEDSVTAIAQENSSSEATTVVVESEKPIVSASDTDEHKFVPYYAGSGSELSHRINDLVSKGFGSRRR
jgi:hypothetical protein